MGAKHAKWFIRSTETTGWLRETELVPKTQGVVSSIKQMKFAINLARHNKAGLEFPPHVAKNVERGARPAQDRARSGSSGRARPRAGRARAREAHARLRRRETLDEIYGRRVRSRRPYLPGENDGQPPVGGANEGMGSRTQADVTPGAEPTKKPEGGA